MPRCPRPSEPLLQRQIRHPSAAAMTYGSYQEQAGESAVVREWGWCQFTRFEAIFTSSCVSEALCLAWQSDRNWTFRAARRYSSRCVSQVCFESPTFWKLFETSPSLTVKWTCLPVTVWSGHSSTLTCCSQCSRTCVTLVTYDSCSPPLFSSAVTASTSRMHGPGIARTCSKSSPSSAFYLSCVIISSRPYSRC